MSAPINIDFPAAANVAVEFADGQTMSVEFTSAPSIEIGFDVIGAGMSQQIYDPTGVAADAFDLSNHHSGTLDDPAIIIDGGLL